MSNNDDYKVGYGKPPKSRQFTKGQSGNSKGRPKKKPNTFQDDIRSVSSTKVRVKGANGQMINKTKRQLLIDQIYNLGIKGNASMAKIALKLEGEIDEVPDFEIMPEDEAVLKSIMSQYNDGGDDENNS